MDKEFSKVYEEMLNRQINFVNKPSLENIEISKKEPLEKFLLSLQEKLREKIEEKQRVEEKINEEKLKTPDLIKNSLEPKNIYIDELTKIDKTLEKNLIKENEDLSSQIQNLKSQITRLSVEGGTWGGGDIGGGGSILPFSGSSQCSCLSGSTDRLISDTQTLILNSDGTISFPNDVISTPTGLIDIIGDLKVEGRIYQNNNDLQSEIESISATSKSVYTAVNTNSAYWDNVYTTFKNASSTFLTSETDSQTLSFNDLNKNLTISNGNTVSLSSLISDTSVRALTSNWENTYTTVLVNSATWNYQGTDIKSLTSSWVGGNSAYTNLISNSAAYLSGVDLSFLSVSGNWNSAYTTVLTNSASWAIDSTTDTGVRSLTSNWENTYSTVRSNSANWSTDVAVRALTGAWQNTFTTVQTNSSNWDYQGSDIKALTGGWIGGNSSYTTVQTYSAFWNSVGSNVSALSSNWQSTYTTVSSNSANWDSAYTTLQANSATWGSAVAGTAEIVIARVHNAETTTLTRGQVVYAFGSNGSIVSVKLASNSSESTSSKTLGFVNGTIAPNGTGYVTVAGSMDQLNFGSPFADGDALWLNATPGAYTRVKPTAPSHSVYLGVVERANAGNGTAYIKVQNGYELNEIHDVLVNGVSAGDVLQRNSTNTLWVPAPLSADKWNSVYTTVQSNSATIWNYQGTDIKTLSSTWVGGNAAYTNLISNSAAYLSAVDLSFLSVSGNWNTTYTIVNANSASWGAITSYSSLIGDSTTNPLTATHNLNTKDIVFSVREVATDKIVYAAGRTIDNNNIELSFNTTPSINQYDLTILCNGGIAGIGSGNTNDFALVKVTTTNYIQNATYTHNLYDDTSAAGQITVTLLPPTYHVAVTQHKKIGSTANVVLSAPNGVTIDGQPTYTLTNQYESIGIYTDGTNYFIE